MLSERERAHKMWKGGGRVRRWEGGRVYVYVFLTDYPRPLAHTSAHTRTRTHMRTRTRPHARMRAHTHDEYVCTRTHMHMQPTISMQHKHHVYQRGSCVHASTMHARKRERIGTA